MMFRVVTSINSNLYDIYGKHTLPVRPEMWEASIEHHIYSEDYPEPAIAGYRRHEFPQWLNDFKAASDAMPERHGRDRRMNRRGVDYDFRLDAVRFAHKVAAITDMMERYSDGVLVWCDADVMTTKFISSRWLGEFLPTGAAMSWLWRYGLYPECGFMMFDLRSPDIQNFRSLLEDTYKSGEIFKHSQTHDSYIILQVVVHLGFMPWNIAGDIGSAYHNVFEHSPLRERLTHWKGKVKHVESSRRKRNDDARR